jgi:filamentous hemagglutinin family protein
MKRQRTRQKGFKCCLGATQAVALGLFFAACGFMSANPTGENVVAGSAGFDRSGSSLTIHTSDRVIINWQDFSINAGELTKFVQPNATSAALNRVVSGNPSAIYGNLQANGQVFLLNPNGILVGGGAVIDTSGFFASTLDVNNSEFLQGGDLHFTGSSAARIENQGSINAIGGDIILVARHIENHGELNAPDGTVALAAGTQVLLAQSGQEKVFVQPAQGSASGTGILNSGAIQAARAELKATGNIYALAINNTGIIRASGAVSKNGRVYLTAKGGTLQHSGIVTAKNKDGTGGRITATARNIALTKKAVVDASGPQGGGEIFIGGNQSGLGPLPNAEAIWIGPDVTISANALNFGNGGKVILFAQGPARIYGTISARGAQGGTGGFIETSGKQYIEILNTPDAGVGGTWLIDPHNLGIIAGGGSAGITTTAGPTFTSTSDAALLGVDLINAALNADSSVIVQTGDGGAEAGDLTMAAGVNILKSAGGAASLTMNAHNDMVLNDITSTSGVLTLALNADSDGSGAGSITLNGNLASNGGDITMHGFNMALNGNIDAGAGMVTLDGAAFLGFINQAEGVYLKADSLLLTGSGLFWLKQGLNDINTIAVAVNGAITYRDANSFSVGTVGGVSGVQTVNGLVSLVAQDSITVNDTGVAGDDVQATSVVDLVSNNLFINGTVSGSRVTLRPYTPFQLIDLGGADAPGTLGLSVAEINRVTTPLLEVGDLITGNITITTSIAPPTVGAMALITQDAVIDGNAAGFDITVATLGILSGDGAGSADPLETAVSNLAFENFVSGDVNIDNTGALTVTSMFGLSTLNLPVSFNLGGDVNLTAASPITFAVNTGAVGNFTATALESAGLGDNLTVNAGVLVLSTGGNVQLTAGDNVLNSGTVRADTGNVLMIAGNDFQNDGAIEATVGNLTLVCDDDFPVRPGMGSSLFIQNGTLTAGGRFLIYTVQPSQVLPSPLAILPPGQWRFDTYYDEAAGLVGNWLLFKIGEPIPPIPPGPPGGGGDILSAELLLDDSIDRNRLHLVPQGPYGIYYSSQRIGAGLDAAPPSADLGLDAAPPRGVSARARVKTPSTLSNSSSFAAFTGQQAFFDDPAPGTLHQDVTLQEQTLKPELGP